MVSVFWSLIIIRSKLLYLIFNVKRQNLTHIDLTCKILKSQFDELWVSSNSPNPLGKTILVVSMCRFLIRRHSNIFQCYTRDQHALSAFYIHSFSCTLTFRQVWKLSSQLFLTDDKHRVKYSRVSVLVVYHFWREWE
jgi:hypothetical protein